MQNKFSNTGKIETGFMSLASMFALFIFLYLAIMGTNPLEQKKKSDK